LAKDFPAYTEDDIRMALKYCEDQDLLKLVKTITFYEITGIGENTEKIFKI